MSTHPMPACEALAADPARYMFKDFLNELKGTDRYEDKYRTAVRMGGYLGALLECDVITIEQSQVLRDEIHAFVWGPAQ